MNNPVNFRANQRYKLLRTEQDRRAKVFDRDMNSLMGYILGISCNLSNPPLNNNDRLCRKPRPATSLPPGRIKGPFARYSDTRHFLNLKSDERGKKDGKKDDKRDDCRTRAGVINGECKKRVKERKHVRFKAEPQVHIIEPHVDNWNILDRPSSAPALVTKYPTLDPRYHQDTRLPEPRHHDPRLLNGTTRSLDHPRITGDKTIEFSSLDYQLYPTPHHRLLSSCWTDSKIRNSVKDKNGRGQTSFIGDNGYRFNRTRSCWEAGKINGYTAQFGS